MKEQRKLVAMVIFLAVFAAAVFMSGTASLAGSLEPPAAPAPTMKTLDEVYNTVSWSRKLSCDSSTNCPRFVVLTDFDNSAVLDKETGLVWDKTLNNGPFAVKDWQGAKDYCQNAIRGDRYGWRLPTLEEISSLAEQATPGYTFAKLPDGHPFIDAWPGGSFWTSTLVTDGSAAYTFRFSSTAVPISTSPLTSGIGYVCVRGGKGSGR